jgi:hypothetical protein
VEKEKERGEVRVDRARKERKKKERKGALLVTET